MIKNAGMLGLDWRTLDLSSYLEALSAHNADHAEKPPVKVSDGLKRFMKARSGGNDDGGIAVTKASPSEVSNG